MMRIVGKIQTRACADFKQAAAVGKHLEGFGAKAREKAAFEWANGPVIMCGEAVIRGAL